MSGTIADWERNRFSAKTADEIDALPEIEEPAHTAPVAAANRCVLLERNYSGLNVSITFMTDTTDELWLDVQEGENGPKHSVQIPPASVFDAFAHPYCYLPAS